MAGSIGAIGGGSAPPPPSQPSGGAQQASESDDEQGDDQQQNQSQGLDPNSLARYEVPGQSSADVVQFSDE